MILHCTIVKRLSEACKRGGQKESGYHFSVYLAPVNHWLIALSVGDTELFGSVKDITDKEYYTNSFHWSCQKASDTFENLPNLNRYPEYAAGGLSIIVNIFLFYAKIQKP